MLISKLQSALNLISEEYAEFKVADLLQQARTACLKKDTLQEEKFRSTVADLILAFKNIERKSKYYNISKEIREKIEGTSIVNSATPKIARYMYSSLSTDKLICMSHGEVSLLQSASKDAFDTIKTFVRVADIFVNGDEALFADRIHLDIIMPRTNVGASLDHMSVALRDFSQFIGLVAEYSNGEYEGGEIVSLSTSEPVVTVAVFVASGIALLTLYNKILESAKKTIDFISAYNAFKIHSEALKGLNVRDLAAAEIERQISVAIDHIKSALPESRKAESKSKIASKAKKIAGIIESGARLRTNALGGVLANGGIEDPSVVKLVEELSQQANEFNELLAGGMPQAELLTFNDIEEPEFGGGPND